MRISDWSSDVCSSDLARGPRAGAAGGCGKAAHRRGREARRAVRRLVAEGKCAGAQGANLCRAGRGARQPQRHGEEPARSEEHTSELQSLMRISYAVFCLKKKIIKDQHRSKLTT